MESEQYVASPAPRPLRSPDRLVTRVRSGLAPALVVCAGLTLAVQVRRILFGTAGYGGILGGDTGLGLMPGLGQLLSDTTSVTPLLWLVACVGGLVGLHLLPGGTSLPTTSVRRAAVAAAGLTAAAGTVVVATAVWWLLKTGGTIGNGDSTTISDTAYEGISFLLSPWDVLLGVGAIGLTTAILGAGAMLLLLADPPRPAPSSPPGGAAADRGQPAVATAAGSAPEGATDALLTPQRPPVDGGSGPTNAPPSDDPVVLVTAPTLDPEAFRRPTSPVRGTADGADPVSADGFRRPR